MADPLDKQPLITRRREYTPVQDLIHLVRPNVDQSADGESVTLRLAEQGLSVGSPTATEKLDCGDSNLNGFLNDVQKAGRLGKLLDLNAQQLEELSRDFLHNRATPKEKEEKRVQLEKVKGSAKNNILQITITLQALRKKEQAARVLANQELRDSLPDKREELKAHLESADSPQAALVIKEQIALTQRLENAEDPMAASESKMPMPEPYKTYKSGLVGAQFNCQRAQQRWMKVSNKHSNEARKMVSKHVALRDGLFDVSLISAQQMDQYAGREEQVLAQLTKLDLKEGVDAEFAKQHYFLARRKEEQANEVLELQLEIKQNYEEIAMLIDHESEQLNSIYHNVEALQCFHVG
eukprot:TRINITY_DN1903_c0_g1_i5.p1 TRINITY_DN1903_c0_g1~~TRINITY_DN1903_c0_g1_i5.p1  ORF type:complete len:352 (-),score=83.10 TRINITY_DN1903_c0_g1_i5:34-1089(-)